MVDSARSPLLLSDITGRILKVFYEVFNELGHGFREVVYRRSLPLATSHLGIALTVAGDQAAILGASQLVTQFVLSPAAIEATLQAAG